ncbi:MAG: hypothetical protein JW743_08025 [Deltaproteobacteria bacterium]|nr:hypothetical protein [Deltaproteobacteria bacterium]
MGGPDRVVEWAGVRVAARAEVKVEAVIVKLQVVIIEDDCLKTICARR